MADEIETLDGPYVQAALFCEKVLEERDGVLSAIRVVDRLFINVSGIGAPDKLSDLPPQMTTLNIVGLVALKSGFARGSHTVVVRGRTPSQQPIPAVSFPVLLEGEDRGANVVFQMGIQAREDGLYWFDVLVNDRLMTRMPLRIVYQRTNIGSGPGLPR